MKNVDISPLDSAPRSSAPEYGSANSSGLRTGAAFLDELKHGTRAIFVQGEKISNPAQHPAFARAARSIARLFDYAADPGNRDLMTFTSPDTGKPVWRCFQIPRSHSDLRAKRLAAEKWAELSFGLIGRTPDHVANFFTGFAAKPDFFEVASRGFGDNVVAFCRHIRETSAYVSYAIVPPMIDRGKPAHLQSDPTLYAGVVKETDGGIYVSGGQQLATGAVFSDYLHLSCIHPLKPGDENHAISIAIPIDAPGLRLYPRRSYAPGANQEDYPLTSRFDETDSFIVLDKVFVPWERVFIYRDVQRCWDQWWKTPAHLYGNHQAQARYGVKLRFMLGIVRRMCEMTGSDRSPAVKADIGELAAYASIVENMLIAQETIATTDKAGVLWPNQTALYSVMALQSQLNAKMVDIMRDISGSAMISLPSSAADLDNPEAAADIERYFQSASSDAGSRIALMRLAWDFVGTEFAGRHQQYEKFYGGASAAVKMNVFRFYDFDRALSMVDQALDLGER